MAEIPSSNPVPPPSGVFQPPKKETGKVQPKKETVRINLPPKPTAAPTIKLPTLPPGGPTGAPSPVGAPSAAAAPAPMLRTAAAAPAKAGAAPAATQRPVTPRAMAPIVPTIKPLDKGLIYGAAVCGLIGFGFCLYTYLLLLKPTVENFSS